MFRESEFGLLCHTLKKSRIQLRIVGIDEPLSNRIEETIRPILGLKDNDDATFRSFLGDLQARTIYRFEDKLAFSYLAFLLSDIPEQVVIIGPYLCQPISREYILEISEINGFSPKRQKVIDDFFASVPIITESSPTLLLIDAFCERMWGSDFTITDLKAGTTLVAPEDQLYSGGKDFDDTFLDMKNMEQRYQMENEIMDAVMLGAESKINQLISLFGEQMFEKRISDPLRNAKNYCIIMNTLLRKAAERGGVHPIYLDRISSRFAAEIEHLSHIEHTKNTMADMFRSYCRLVKKHSTKAYSPIVQNAILAIEADPSVEMNLHKLAKKLNVSNVYLSSVFKKETGKTITEYIRNKRLSYAEHLLEHTNLQIQTIALHCGMVDVHYFSKQFKRHTGKTPTAFRCEKLRRNLS